MLRYEVIIFPLAEQQVISLDRCRQASAHTLRGIYDSLLPLKWHYEGKQNPRCHTQREENDYKLFAYHLGYIVRRS
jgi:hypothetical protein